MLLEILTFLVLVQCLLLPVKWNSEFVGTVVSSRTCFYLAHIHARVYENVISVATQQKYYNLFCLPKIGISASRLFMCRFTGTNLCMLCLWIVGDRQGQCDRT